MSAPKMHHGWKSLGAEIDQQIRVLLARGNKPERVAVMVGVASGYVEALQRELADVEGDDAPSRDAPRPAPRPPEPGMALSRVHCLVAGEEIGARECISRQCSQKCFCPKASFAINAIAPTVLPGTRLEDELARCRAVARSVLLKGNVEERHLGPALVALRGGKPVLASLIAGELPAPPKPEEKKRGPAPSPSTWEPIKRIEPRPTLAQTYREAQRADPAEVAAAVEATRASATKTAAKRLCTGGCGSLFASPKYDKCWRCRVGLKKHRGDAPDTSHTDVVPAPTPAKEKSMPPPSPIKNVSDADFRKAYEEAQGSIKALSERFTAAGKTVRARIVELGLQIRVGGHLPKTNDNKPAAVAKPTRAAPPPRIASPAATNSDPDQRADEFERMRRIVEDFQALSREGRQYVSGRLSSLSAAA